ncbi:MAG: hypothetical protein IPM46_13030 [Flavobacteriales bacterium]|nr:hypothetical protein [Flavobacteriales bacterium]
MQQLPWAALAATAILTTASHGQTCLFSADFESGSLPAGWQSSTSTIIATGEDTPAWIVGNSAQANAGGFFPVPDAPIGNRFAMTNDDAPPCDCDLGEATLETAVIDLSGQFNIALDLRAHHDQALGGGEAWIDFSVDGGAWTPFVQVPAASGWQHHTFNMNLLGGTSALRLRLRWSDNGSWASGFAIDDFCIRGWLTHDLAITGARIGDDLASPFAAGTNGLGYRLLPLEQSRAMAVSIDLHNRGSAALYDVDVTVVVQQNGVDHGSYQAVPIDTLLSGSRATVVVTTDWAPDALGDVAFTASALSPTGEEDGSDNSAAALLTMTGPGWDDGYGTMALDGGQVQGSIGSELGFIAANRFELTNNGSTAFGASAVLGTDSQVGEFVRAILMDGNLAFLDTSTRHEITEADIDLAWGGGPLYLPFSTAPVLPAGDYFVGFQRLTGSGRVSVATSGNCVAGASAFMEGNTFDITWTTAAPMVRLHLNEYLVGVSEVGLHPRMDLTIQPQPMSEGGTIGLFLRTNDRVSLRLLDALGRTVKQIGTLSLYAGAHALPLDVELLPAGTYFLEATGATAKGIVPVMVVR